LRGPLPHRVDSGSILLYVQRIDFAEPK
jgi:hypothetical protein